MIQFKLDNLIAHPELDSLQIIRSNLLFSTQGDYTLDIDFSLYVKENILIFGHYDEIDYTIEEKTGDAELEIDDVLILKGKYTVVGYENHCVKIQILAGISELGIIDTGKSIRNLNLGSLKIDNDDMDLMNQRQWPEADGCYVPVIIGSYSYYNIFDYNALKYIMNCPDFSTGLVDARAERVNKLPFLAEAVERVFGACGWNMNRSFFYNTNWQRLYIVHGYFNETRFERILPDWSITQFLDEVRKLLNCEFVFDIINRTVKLVDRRSYYDNCTVYNIPFSKVVNVRDDLCIELQEFQTSLNYDKFRYDLPSGDWYMHQDIDPNILNACTYDLFENRENYNFDDFVIFKPGPNTFDPLFVQTNELRRICSMQRMGDWNNDDDNDGMKLSIVPAWIDDKHVFMTYEGDMSFEENLRAYMLVFPIAQNCDDAFTPIEKDKGLYKAIQNGVDYDPFKHNTMFVAFKGDNNLFPGQYTYRAYQSWVSSCVNNFVTPEFWAGDDKHKWDMAPQEMFKHYYQNTINLANNQLYRIKFIGDYNLDINAKFVICNRTFLCKELRYNVVSGHLNKIVEGDFIPIDNVENV